MSVPQLSVVSSSPAESSAPVVVGVVKSEDGARLALPDELVAGAFAPVAAALGEIGATGAVDQLRHLPTLGDLHAPVVLVGMGGDAVTPDVLRNAAGAAVRQLAGSATIHLALPVRTAADVSAVAEGAALAAYSFTDYRSASAKDQKASVAEVVIHAPAIEGPDAILARARVIAESVHLVRDLVNTPANDLYPQTFADRVTAAAAGLPIEFDVLDESALAAQGFGGILGVGQGSSRPPRLVVARYSPAGAARHLALVGKGITFDSGGLSLKPPTGMVGMKYDMTGAASAFAVVLAAASLGVATKVTAWLCLAENLPSGTAIRPNDVLRIRGGKTVEVLNTDAEGRLVLADGIVAASEEHPDAIVDIATLTGAARTAMGERVVPVMGDAELSARIQQLGQAEGEPVWPMPLPGELRSVIDSDIADIANAKPGHTAGGMLIAGLFLKFFVGQKADGSGLIPWAHLDIAGAANNNGAPYGATPKGPTGVMVRTLVALTESLSRP